MYQIEIFQKWLLNSKNTIWNNSPFRDWMKAKYNVSSYDKDTYRIVTSDFVFRLTKQETYILNQLESMPYPLTSEQIVGILNMQIRGTNYDN